LPEATTDVPVGAIPLSSRPMRLAIGPSIATSRTTP
jgi:hypothetical protein